MTLFKTDQKAILHHIRSKSTNGLTFSCLSAEHEALGYSLPLEEASVSEGKEKHTQENRRITEHSHIPLTDMPVTVRFLCSCIMKIYSWSGS